MSTKAKSELHTPWDSNVKIYQWSGLGNGDIGEALNYPHFADRSIQVKGTFGEGGTVLLEGSNDREKDSLVWATLNDPQGNALSFTEAKIEQVLESSYLIRPRVTDGDETTDLTVTILIRR